MLGLKSHMNFYLCHGSVDMRKGIVSLSGKLPKLAY